MKHLFIFLSAFVLISATCKKDNVPDPNSFYFRCKVDGRDFRPDNCANCIASTILGDTVLIFGANSGWENISIGITDASGVKQMQYQLNEDLTHRGAYKNSTSPDDRYYTNDHFNGAFTIESLDKSQQIITGTFSFEAFNGLRNKKVTITEGKFRLKYITY